MVATVAQAPGRPAASRSTSAKASAGTSTLGGIRGRSKASRLAAFVLGTIWLVFVLAPIYYMVLISFRSPAQYLTANAWLPTGGLTLSSYSAVFDSAGDRDVLP